MSWSDSILTTFLNTKSKHFSPGYYELGTSQMIQSSLNFYQSSARKQSMQQRPYPFYTPGIPIHNHGPVLGSRFTICFAFCGNYYAVSDTSIFIFYRFSRSTNRQKHLKHIIRKHGADTLDGRWLHYPVSVNGIQRGFHSGLSSWWVDNLEIPWSSWNQLRAAGNEARSMVYMTYRINLSFWSQHHLIQYYSQNTENGDSETVVK